MQTWFEECRLPEPETGTAPAEDARHGIVSARHARQKLDDGRRQAYRLVKTRQGALAADSRRLNDQDHVEAESCPCHLTAAARHQSWAASGAERVSSGTVPSEDAQTWFEERRRCSDFRNQTNVGGAPCRRTKHIAGRLQTVQPKRHSQKVRIIYTASRKRSALRKFGDNSVRC